MLFEYSANSFLEIGGDILERSHPNTRYFQIACSTLEFIISTNSKRDSSFSRYLESRSNLSAYFAIFHGTNIDSNTWGIYLNANHSQEVDSHLKRRFEELGFDYALLLTCNPLRKTRLNVRGFDILFPQENLYSLTTQKNQNSFIYQAK